MIPCSGKAARSRSRRRCSTSMSACVTKDRSGFASICRSRRKCRRAIGSVSSQAAWATSSQRRSSASDPRRNVADHSGPNGAPPLPVEATCRSRADPRCCPGRTAAPVDLEADPVPEHLDLAAGPDRGPVRRAGTRTRSSARPRSRSRRSSPDRPRRRPRAPARCPGRRIAGHRGRGQRSRRRGPAALAATSASRAVTGRALSRATANPRPASYGVSSGVMSLDQTR